jgi:hypothetical protein
MFFTGEAKVYRHSVSISLYNVTSGEFNAIQIGTEIKGNGMTNTTKVTTDCIPETHHTTQFRIL